MFIAQLEQMRRYGVAYGDIRAAMRFYERLSALDRAVFPRMPCFLQAARNGGPSSCAQYITLPDGGETYMLYVDLLSDRLAFQAIGLMAEHAHHGTVSHPDAWKLVVDAIALHEVRHRLQRHEVPAAMYWCVSDLPTHDGTVVAQILQTLAPGARTAQEIDARIVEYLYVTDRIRGTDDPVAAVRRLPR